MWAICQVIPYEVYDIIYTFDEEADAVEYLNSVIDTWKKSNPYRLQWDVVPYAAPIHNPKLPIPEAKPEVWSYEEFSKGLA